METIFRGLQSETLLIYLHDILIFSWTLDEHLERLEEVLKRHQDVGIKLKRHLFATKVNFLGHVINQEGIHTDPQKVTAVQYWPQPRHRTDVRGFLGTTWYYRRFIPSYAELSKPLAKLTSKNETIQWTDDCEEAFRALKQALTESPILSHPVFSMLFILDTNTKPCGDRGGPVPSEGWTEEADSLLLEHDECSGKQLLHHLEGAPGDCRSRETLPPIFIRAEVHHQERPRRADVVYLKSTPRRARSPMDGAP